MLPNVHHVVLNQNRGKVKKIISLTGKIFFPRWRVKKDAFE